ncbi:DUF6232 family protein [Phytohabitans kaempferiae]|uniref:DUF6232 family protein n=1 Tax=Phytohabitans kaempferiae TaxID=1620943 RepID=A0ABV6LXJ9_9ACTN
MSIDHLSRPSRSPGTTFYNRHGVAITDRWLIVRGTRFAIADLHRLTRARGPRSSPTRTTATAGVVALAVVAPVAVAFGTPAAWAIAALTVAAALAGIRFAGRRWAATFQMWADYESRPTLLFETGDEQEFGQVCRALIRAVEQGRLSNLS